MSCRFGSSFFFFNYYKSDEQYAIKLVLVLSLSVVVVGDQLIFVGDANLRRRLIRVPLFSR